jgi:hypothetical protein
MGADYIHGRKGGQRAPTGGAKAGTDGAGACISVKRWQM